MQLRKFNETKGKVYWITGLSGAGKTTIGKELYNYIKARKDNIVFLDGDIARKAYLEDLGYTSDERIRGAYRTSRICNMLSDQGIDVIICIIAMYDEIRRWNRENIENYIEVFLDVPMEVLIERDQKSLYSSVLNGKIENVAGMDMNVEYPVQPDLKILNDGSKTPEEIVQQLASMFIDV